MLLTPSEDNSATNFSWNIYNITNNKFLESKIVVPYDKRFGGSSKGWVITINKDWTVTLYKPYSMVQGNNNANHTCIIQLPAFFSLEYEDDSDDDDIFDLVIDPKNVYCYCIYKALLSDDPLANPNKECMLVVIFSDMKELAFIRLGIGNNNGHDLTWTKIQPAEYFNSDDILFYKDLCYAVTIEDSDALRKMNSRPPIWVVPTF
ncbi:hypothetical protein G4B88_012057 [Cannabis sativa]|uniref:KIB1-4 beta-propeller domain-containing protein n=1 Tax=Cannabis sativa TaxID=3483 RepID=A0A7J6EVN4_CANSA|nr:hypothetical protein G4B88_012057 [Cannabis sativa]